MSAIQRSAGPLAPRSALLSPCGHYRYELRRTWDPRLPVLRWMMLNPSTADGRLDDATVRRCIAFARAWGFGGIVIHNLFALRATKPVELRRHPDPVGTWSDAFLLAVPPTLLTIAAWGTNGGLLGRDRRVLSLLARRGVRLHHLGPLTNAGHPRHPLYVRADARPSPFEPLHRAPSTARSRCSSPA